MMPPPRRMKTYSWFVPPAPPADDPARLHPARWSSGNRVVRDMVGAYPGVLVLHILSYLIGSGIAAIELAADLPRSGGAESSVR